MAIPCLFRLKEPNSRTYFLVKGLIISRKIEDRDVLNEDNTFTIQIANRKEDKTDK